MILQNDSRLYLSRKTRLKEVTMKLQTTKLCVNCESLYEEIGPCPYCRSEVFVWLFRALGTAIEANTERMIDFPSARKEYAVSRPQAHPFIAPTISFGDTMMKSRSFADLRTALNKLGREMVQVLTLGMIHV